jgi:hypothetical protein
MHHSLGAAAAKEANMAGGKNDDFLKNPEQFLKKNLLVVRIQKLVFGAVERTLGEGHTDYRGRNAPKFTEGQILTVDIRKMDMNQNSSCYAKNSTGSYIDACELVEAEGVASTHSHRFTAFYLPFFNNQAKIMKLLPPLTAQAAPNFYVTDEMTGCAFAVEGGARPRVGHFNFTTTGTDDGDIDDAEINRRIRDAFGVPAKSLKKGDYKQGAHHHVTLIGINSFTGWTFWWQRFSYIANKKGKYVYQIDAAPYRV